ncbi:efflux RND transporter periplasmic adaptor subunit [Mesoterricola sediminis]|uniref:RND transporter n=1 Tax=Mesoterricola sediminis TaxID=2927980 RepID=A0AA48GRK4_9BACT|nr:efflux RND transporter periplasmic adaptor subunit [Mesoterricola sediminis]BDU76314.1 RND transporter [Mesoterricola sediminis]
MARLRTWIITGAGAVGLAGSLGWMGLRSSSATPEYSVEAARVQDLRDSVAANGEVQARTKVNVGVQVTAAIREIHVKDGQWVKAGDLLVTLDQERYRQALNQAEMGLRMSRKDLEIAQATWTKQEQTFRRNETLHGQGLVSAEEFQQVKLARDTAATSLERARVAVQQSEAQVAIAQDDLSKTVIRASMSGQVTGLKAEKGETAIAGTTNLAGAVLMVISDLSEMMGEVRVGELEVVKVKEGQPAEITVDALPGSLFRGKVMTVATGTDRPANASSTSQETQTYKVRVLIEGTPEALGALKPGMSARIAVLTSEHKGVLTVPLAAIQDREVKGRGLGLLAGSRSVVYVAKDGKVQEREIQTGLSTRRAAEVLSGVKAGELVVTGPTKLLTGLTDGAAVKLQKGQP